MKNLFVLKVLIAMLFAVTFSSCRQSKDLAVSQSNATGTRILTEKPEKDKLNFNSYWEGTSSANGGRTSLNIGQSLQNKIAGVSVISSGGGVPGAAIAGGGFALADAAKDVAHHLRSKEYQAAAYSHELVEKARTMANQIRKYDQIFAMQLTKYVEEFDLYVNKYIYDPKKKKSNSYLDLDYYQSLLENKAFNKKEKEEPTILLNYLKQMKSENR